MRSSTISSSRSYTSKHKLKDVVICPIKQKQSKIFGSSLINNNHRRSSDRFSFKDYVSCGEQINAIPFITMQKEKIALHEEGLKIIQEASKQQKIQFIGCLGNRQLLNDFFSIICQLPCSTTQSKSQFSKNMIVIYNLTIKKRDKMLYFISISQKTEQTEKDMQKMLYILSNLSISIFLSLGQQQLQSKNINKMNAINIFSSNHRHKVCHVIYKDHIIIDQMLSSSLQQNFESIVLCSISSKQNNQVVSNSTQSKMIRLIQELIQNQQTSNHSYHYFLKRFVKSIIQFFLKGEKPTQNAIIIHLYHLKIAESINFYEKHTNNLQIQKISSIQELLIALDQIKQKTVSLFNNQVVDQKLHNDYLEQILIFMELNQQKVIQNYEYVGKQSQQYSIFGQSDDNCQEEVNNSDQLIKQIQILKQIPQNNHFTHEKIMILARNAARLKILGYDQKQKIALLRQEIDQKWKELKMVIQQKMKQDDEPTQHNLVREKYKIMQQKMNNHQNRVKAIKQQILLFRNIYDHQCCIQEIKAKEYLQFCKIKQKNVTIMKYVYETTVQSPLINTLRSQIIELTNKNDQMLRKKVIIIASVQKPQKDLMNSL